MKKKEENSQRKCEHARTHTHTHNTQHTVASKSQAVATATSDASMHVYTNADAQDKQRGGVQCTKANINIRKSNRQQEQHRKAK